ncbi:cytochrome D1 domain-containing protein [Undibacterium sp. Ren11W]|uniref:cytochrome D1 domain-containing protein n=1 Tax=Undibacterium sp. Ren11W TaxID=3413045 RepID=UPI003BF33DFA
MLSSFRRFSSQLSSWFFSLLFILLAASQVLPAEANSAPILIVSQAQQLSMFDGQAQSILASFNFPFPLHEKIWRSSDDQFAYLSSPEGWLIQVDLQAGVIRRQLRVAQQTTGIALSADDRYLMVANSRPTTLIALNAVDFSLIRKLEVKDKNGKASAVAAIHSATARKSFIAVMRDIPELWEMSYDEHAEPVYEGFVHDYKMGEGIALRGPFPPRRTLLEQPLRHVLFDADATHAIGAGENGLHQIINLNIRRKILEFTLSSSTLANAGLIVQRGKQSLLLLPSATQNTLFLIDMLSGQLLNTLDTTAPPRSLMQDPRNDDIWLNHPTDSSTAEFFVEQVILPVAGSPVRLLRPNRQLLARSNDVQNIIVHGDDEKEFLIIDSKTWQLLRRLRIPP